MILRCTKKLLDTYKIKPAEDIVSDDLYSWHADLFYVDRRKCIIFMNDATKFCIALFDISQKEFETEAINLWLKSFILTAASFRISPDAIEKYLSVCMRGDSIPFSKTNNRSVVSYMCKYKERIKDVVYDYIRVGVLHSIELNHWLNDYPIASTGFDCAYNILAKKLKGLHGFNAHQMKLNPKPFEQIAAGTKIFEIRLNDEKRQALNICDEIVFTNADSGSELRRNIWFIKSFPSFKELFKDFHFHPRVLGCEDDCTEEEFITMMRKYYSPEEEKKFGVLAIRLGEPK